MRRPQPAFRLVAVIAGLLVLLTIAAPAAARSDARSGRGPRIALETADAVRLARLAPQARRARVSGAACTGWKSTRTPPRTIRVLRSKRSQVDRDVVGIVQEVPFREYVGTVVAAEWPTHYPIETIKAGALAVKQYAWYYTIVYRGGEVKLRDGSTACYDIKDTTADQYYYPEDPDLEPTDKILRAIESSWPLTVRRYRPATASSTFFLTGYRAGRSVACGTDTDGWKLYQNSTRRCGQDGLRMLDILRLYLEPRLEIVSLGRHDIVGNERGDASAFVVNGQDELVAHVWDPSANPPGPGTPTAQVLARDALIGAVSSDADGDGRDDLVWMRRTSPSEARIRVARSSGDDYGAEATWYAGTTNGPLDDAILLAGDFDADERRDIAVLARDGDGHAAVHVFRKAKSGDAFRPPRTWWSGALEFGRIRDAWAGDVSGDGRADLIVLEDIEDGGMRIRIALGKRPGIGLKELRTRFTDTSLKPSRVRIVPGDADRDGREDLFLVTRDGNPGRVDRLSGRPGGALVRSRLWRAPKSDPFIIRDIRLGVADVDVDGHSDLLVYTKDGRGTRIRVLESRYTSMSPALSIRTPIAWEGLRPY
jgi:hypothetical protein